MYPKHVKKQLDVQAIWEAAAVCNVVTRDNHTALYVEKFIYFKVL